jgi:ribosome maturation protein SDO1
MSVSKAQTAPTSELAKAFGADVPVDNIIQEILRKGEVQVGERERKEILERIEKEVVDFVSGRVIDPVTKRVYTPGMIEKALNQLSAASGQPRSHQASQIGEKLAKGKDTDPPSSRASTPTEAAENSASQDQRKPRWTGVVTNKSAKSQALEAMKALIAWQPIPVMRARMQLRVTCPISLLKQSSRAMPPAVSGTEPLTATSKPKKKGNKPKSRTVRHHDSDAEETDLETVPRAPSNVKDRILSYIESVETQKVLNDNEWEVIGFAEPGALKGLSEFVGAESRGRGRVEVLDMAVMHED